MMGPSSAKARFDGKRVILTDQVNGQPFGILVERHEGRWNRWIAYHDEQKLGVFFSMMYGDIEWQP